MKLAYYPGCSIHSTAKEYERSAQVILKEFDLELEEIADWSCCGALEAAAVSHLLSVSLPARNLAIAGSTNSGEIIMLCSACQQVHNKAKDELKEKPELRRKVSGIIGRPVNTDVNIRHLLYYMGTEIKTERIKRKVRNPLCNLKVSPYYGCCVDRPSRFIRGDDPNCPHTLEDILESLGIEILYSAYRTRCCGGTSMLTDDGISTGLTKKIIAEAKNSNADCIAIVCPLCSMALENASLKLKSDIPIVYFTQLVGLAFGYDEKTLGLDRHLIPADKLINKIKAGTKINE